MHASWPALLILLPATVVSGFATSAPSWQELPPEKFEALPAVRARIDFANFNHDLMAAAIFHETNRVRQKMGLRQFRHLTQLDAAADTQAAVGAAMIDMSHHNPLHSLAWVSDRVAAVGLEPRTVAENIALTPALDAGSAGSAVSTRVDGDRRVAYDPHTGRDFRPLSYAEFAALVVLQWMESPGHRANLLNPELRCLGCSARWRKEISGVDMLYSVQVFFTPAQPTSSGVNQRVGATRPHSQL